MARYSAAFFADGDVTLVVETFETSLSLMRAVGDEWGVAFVLGWIARCRVAVGDTTQGIMDVVRQNVETHQRLGDTWGTGMAMGMLASLSLNAADLAAARDYAEQAQALRTQVGHRHSLAVGWDLLADIAVVENNPDDAAAAYREAIALLENLGNRPYADELRGEPGRVAGELPKTPGRESKR